MGKYAPTNCVWEMTLACNMRCIHCGSSAGRKRENELSLDEAKNLALELLALGCKRISLIGGEVFLYGGWEEVAKLFSEGGALANIITNGYMLGEEEIRKIRYAELSNVCFSVDGLEGNHDRIRNRPGSFKRVLSGFELLRKEGIPFAVVTTLLDFNFDDLEGMYGLFVENGVEAWQIQLANSMGNLSHGEGLTIDKGKIPFLTAFIKRKKDEGAMNIYAADDIGYYDANEKYIRGRLGEVMFWPGCQAGLTVVGIDSIGNVKGCESLYSDEFIEGNVREESLTEIWGKKGNFAYNRDFKRESLTGNCSSCDMGEFCRGGCKGISYFNKGYLFEHPYCHYNKGSAASCEGLPTRI